MRYLVLFCLVLCLFPLSISSAQTDFTPSFEEARCAFTIPQGQQVDCGYLTVPEDWNTPDGPTIRLHVAIFRTPNPNPAPDPILYLEGGPGGSATSQMENGFNLLFEPFITNRDMIVIDQRGTGESEPSLACPEANELGLEVLPQALGVEEEATLELQAIAACNKRLVNEGINLSAYTSAQNATDMAALTQALGYDTVNLYGVSYGTRLALTMLRDHPEGIRSVVLDSSYPLQEDLFATAAPHFERSLQLLFASCLADAICNSTYPDLETTTFEVAEQLKATPFISEFTSPTSNTTYNIALTDYRFMNFLFQALYQTGWLPYLPQIITDAQQGQFDLLLTLYTALIEGSDTVSYGMNLSVQCADEIAFGDPANIQSASSESPLQPYMDSQINTGRYMYQACQLWNNDSSTPNPIENEAVTSNIPTLILAGEFDPITPPAWGETVHGNLPNSFFYILPATGHGAALGNECASELLLNFWDTPTDDPEPSCFANLPAMTFVAPNQAPALDFEPFTSSTYQLVGIKPVGWEEYMDGMWIRPGLYDTALVEIGLPNVGKEAVMGSFLAQLGMEGEPTLIETREANGYTWDVYQTIFQGMVVYMGVAEGDDLIMMVMLQARETEATGLYDALFLPVVDALQQE